MTTPLRTSEARERLLRTASALFYAEGLRGVGVDRVVAEASVTRATFYRHFPGKEDLVVAYLQAADQALRDQAGEVRADASAGNWLRRVTSLVGGSLCAAGFRGCAFINAAAEYPDPASPVRQAVRAHRDWLEDSVRTAFAAVDHPDPAEAARHWVVLRDGAMVGGYLADAAQAQAVLESSVRALLAEAPAASKA